MPEVTHDALCDLAVRWLHGSGGCKVVFREPTFAEEQPDAFGFRWPHDTVLIEVKVSRSDFLADRKKRWRRMPQTGMGRERYYLVPKGLVQPEELPDGWGLLIAYPSGVIRQVTRARPVPEDARNLLMENHLMFAALRRTYQAGRWGLIESAWNAPDAGVLLPPVDPILSAEPTE